MQDFKRDVEELDAPWCAEETQRKAVAYMDQYIDALVAFMSEESDSTVEEELGRADELLEEFKLARTALRVNYLD